MNLDLDGNQVPFTSSQSFPSGTLLGIFLLSAATLIFEINLTRYLSISQFYHFAFMVVSIALLGYGVSGTFLVIFPSKNASSTVSRLSFCAQATTLSILGSYIIVNLIPFDSFSLFIDPKQFLILILHYLVLAAPFFFSGLAVGLLISIYPGVVGKTYAANLVGSGAGCALALFAPSLFGVPGTVLLSTVIAGCSSFIWVKLNHQPISAGKRVLINKYPIISLILIIVCIFGIYMFLSTGQVLTFLEINLSPYKSLSYALQYPGSELISQNCNAYSRVDVLDSPGIRSLPGASTKYMQPPPAELGLFVDGENLNPIVLPEEDNGYAPYLPVSIAYILRPGAQTLILGPEGGLDILTALAMNAKFVTAVELNPLIIEAAAHVYNHPQVLTVQEADRSFSKRTSGNFDIVVLSLTSTFHPIRSGAYTLSEDYRYTLEAFQDALQQLNPDGILVFNRWLQNPPSETLRAFATVTTALEEMDYNADSNIVVFRGYNMATFLVKKQPFLENELRQIEIFLQLKGFDLIYSQTPTPDLVNQHNILQTPIYAEIFSQFIAAQSKQEFYAQYPYEVSPPTDDRPFFGHYFKWSQLDQVIDDFRQYWQPFGGAGFLVVIILLGISIILAALLIIIPVWISNLRKSNRYNGRHTQTRLRITSLVYFSMLGFGYLLIEIPIIHIFILYLGNPTYAITVVLFSLLVFSGLGSSLSHRINLRWSLALLILLALLTAYILPTFIDMTLIFPLWLRFCLTTVLLAPLAFLMGVPFPAGIQLLPAQVKNPENISWFWAANGSASVISAILAALLAISFGYHWVLISGAIAYTLAFLAKNLSTPDFTTPHHP